MWVVRHFIADQQRRETADDFYCLAFPLIGKALFRTARGGPGRALRRGGASLDGEDRSELLVQEGKQVRAESIPETLSKPDGLR